jgi:hypothetical protein
MRAAGRDAGAPGRHSGRMQRTPVVSTVLTGLVASATALLLASPPTAARGAELLAAAGPGPVPGNRGWTTPAGEDAVHRLLGD